MTQGDIGEGNRQGRAITEPPWAVASAGRGVPHGFQTPGWQRYGLRLPLPSRCDESLLHLFDDEGSDRRRGAGGTHFPLTGRRA